MASIPVQRNESGAEDRSSTTNLGIASYPTSGLTPPTASFGLSPGASSDLSNEAAQGHSFNTSASITADSNALLTSMQSAGPHFATQTMASSSAQDSGEGVQSSARIVRGFDGDQNNDGSGNDGMVSNGTLDSITGLAPVTAGGPSDLINNSTPTMPASPSMRAENGLNGYPLYGAGASSNGSAPASSTLQSLSAANNSFSGSNTASYASANSTTNTLTAQNTPADELIPTTFDESTLRALCDMDCGMPLLYDRIKQSMIATNHAAAFFKKRAAIEEEYGRSMMKLAKSTAEAYGASEAKAGSYVSAWQSLMRTHEVLGDSRVRFAHKLSEISEELANLSKEVDKNRKYARDTGNRLERNLLDAETSVEKSRTRFDSAAEDLERLLLLKSGESAKGGELQGLHGSGPPGKRTLGKAIGKGGLLFKNKNPQQILRQEEEIRLRTSNASDMFRKEVLSTQGIRQEYFNLQLPRILRSLKESSEEIDNGLQYHLSRYAFLFESTVLSDGMSITPIATVDGATGLKSAVETIDNRTDFKQYMQNYSVLHGREYKGPRREGPYEEGFVAGGSGSAGAGSGGGAMSGGVRGLGLAHAASGSISTVSSKPIFGVGLAEQMIRDNVDIPPILEKCAEAIEEIGLENKGIYRLSGTTSKVQRLKAKFDADWSSVDLMEDEAINDINIVAGCLKLWFRELPEPLMTWDLYGGFIEAAKIENDRLRHIRMHERVNDLPDANYATLKYLMGHLDKIRSRESLNQMSSSNLAIVFGPTLLNPPTAEGSDADPSGANLQDMSFQCKAIETILDRYEAIFVDEEE